jgi:hypothetical protein
MATPVRAAARPGAAAVVFDLDAAAAAAAEEATHEPMTFTYHGESYSIPNQADWPMTAVRAFGAGELDTALEMLIGEAALNRLTNAGIKLGELTLLFEEAGKRAGMGDLPNSGPPPRRGSTRR